MQRLATVLAVLVFVVGPARAGRVEAVGAPLAGQQAQDDSAIDDGDDFDIGDELDGSPPPATTDSIDFDDDDFPPLDGPPKPAGDDIGIDDGLVGIDFPGDSGPLFEPAREGHPFTNGVGMSMAWVEPGRFYMGSSGGSPYELPVHAVAVDEGFWLGATEVTQAQYELVIRSNPSSIRTTDRPVENVSWTDAVDFCRKLTSLERDAGRLPVGWSYALPSEAQWEYACRAGALGRRYWKPADDAAWYAGNAEGMSHPVGLKRPNDWGFYDIIGNVWEWCADRWHDDYEGAPADGSVREEGSSSERVVRGGSWGGYVEDCRSAVRKGRAENYRSKYLGLRVALVRRDLTPELVVDAPRPGRGFSNSLGMRFAWLEPGSFYMGSSEGAEDEWPVHQASVAEGFWMGSHEVTQAEYERVMGSNPSYFKGPTLPVETVSWDDAMAFCRKLTEQEQAAGRLPEGVQYTLPSEVQWEFACRSGSIGRRPGAVEDLAWFSDNAAGTTREVGSREANDWGMYDMLGNVWEWCLDSWRDNYDVPIEPPDVTDGPELPDIDDDIFGPDTKDPLIEEVGGELGPEFGSDANLLESLEREAVLAGLLTDKGDTPLELEWRVLRGGSFYSEAWQCRSSNRNKGTTNYRYKNCGFRVALVVVDDIATLDPFASTKEYDATPSTKPAADDPFGGFDDDDDPFGGNDPFSDEPPKTTPPTKPAPADPGGFDDDVDDDFGDDDFGDDDF